MRRFAVRPWVGRSPLAARCRRRRATRMVTRARTATRATLWAVVAYTVLACWMFAMPPDGATFSGPTTNPTNGFQADVLAPPTSLSPVSSCTGGPYVMPTLVGTGTPAEGTSGSVLSVNRTVGQLNDLVVVIVVAGASAAPPVTGTTPAFTVASSGSLTNISAHVMYRWITNVATEPTTYTFQPGSGRAMGVARVYRNVDPTTPFGTAATPYLDSTGGGLTYTNAPTVTTATDKNLVIAVQGVRSGNGNPSFANPTGTALTNVTTMLPASYGVTSVTGRLGDIAMTTAGATGISAISHNSYQYRAGLQVPLLPGQVGQITVTWSTTNVPAWADGYILERINGAVTEATFAISGRATATYADVTAGNGTFTYSLRSTANSWRSSTLDASVTRSC
jgi:hypothetical protein